MEILYELKDIDDAAKQLCAVIKNYKIIILIGDLGAGKTTLITAVSKQYKTAETVTSPTYSLIHEYHFDENKVIYHIDLYRIKSVKEAIDAGVEECITSGHLCFIEWPQVAMPLLPDSYFAITIQSLTGSKRKLIAQLH